MRLTLYINIGEIITHATFGYIIGHIVEILTVTDVTYVILITSQPL